MENDPANMAVATAADATINSQLAEFAADPQTDLSMMKTGHLKTINELADHQPMVKDADLKTWVDMTLPKVREHAGHVMAAAAKKGLPTDLKIETASVDKGM